MVASKSCASYPLWSQPVLHRWNRALHLSGAKGEAGKKEKMLMTSETVDRVARTTAVRNHINMMTQRHSDSEAAGLGVFNRRSLTSQASGRSIGILRYLCVCMRTYMCVCM